MKIKWKLLILCILLPLAVGGLAYLITADSMEQFSQLKKPPLSPPGWLFPVVWTLLYTMMGIALYLVLISTAPQKKTDRALRLFAVQLLLNFGWTPLFFKLSAYWFAFVWLLALWVFVFLTRRCFGMISKPSGKLLLPYLLWITFAGYLNAGIAWLN